MNRFKIIPSKQPTGPKLNDDRTIYLFWGANFLGGHANFKDRKEVEECWATHKEKLMATWFRQYIPGTRCWSWWEFDSPGKLLVVGMMAFTNMRGEKEIRKRYPDGKLIRGYKVYEEEDEFLERHGLLLPFEIEPVRELRESRKRSREILLSQLEFFDEVTEEVPVQALPEPTVIERPIETPIEEEVVPEGEPLIPPSPEKPAPVEPAGMCPRCGRRLKGLDSERSLCVGCGATFDRETLAKLWKSVDQAERERLAGHRVGEN
jgi:hypothetical protein